MRALNTLGAFILLCVVLVGCRGQTSKEPPVTFIRNMHDQPRYDVQSKSPYFSDKRTMRPPVGGTVPREMELDVELSQGVLEDQTGYVMTVPEDVTRHFGGAPATLKRGRERFNIYCSPCHDRTGSGNGIVVQRGLNKPPTFHQDRLRHAPDGQIFATITNGIRTMPSYRAQIPVHDRWAIVSYLRALQLSQGSKSVTAMKSEEAGK